MGSNQRMTPEGNIPRGELTVISGPMYAGKTSYLLQKILWLKHQDASVLVVKPGIDNRYKENEIVTHNKLSFPCFSMNVWDDVVENFNLKYYNYNTVFLDEVQFMDSDSTLFHTEEALRNGVNIVAAGLDQDSRGIPFETTSRLLGLADKVEKITAFCNECGQAATKTQRIKAAGGRVAVGSTGMYEPRCIKHWSPK
jgi:thymidine kinase